MRAIRFAGKCVTAHKEVKRNREMEKNQGGTGKKMEILKKVSGYIAAVLALAAGVLAFYFVDVEGLLWALQKEPPVNSGDIVSADSDDWLGDVAGREAGEGIRCLTSGEEWEELNKVDYVTVKPAHVYKTGVYKLADWADPSRRSRNGTYRGSKSNTKNMPFDYLWGYAPYLGMEYNPYYIVELEDGSRILAMMSRSAASRASHGKSMPLGVKEYYGGNSTALKEVCESMGVSMEYYLRAIDEEWIGERALFILVGKAVCGVAALALVVVIDSVVEKKLKKKSEV